MSPDTSVSKWRYYTLGVLTVGVLDITDAFLFFGIRNGVAPARILQSVAAGLIGKDAATSGGMQTAALGLFLHFVIAALVVGSYFIAARYITVLTIKPVICGILFGVIAYGVMNYVVLPLSATGGGGTPKVTIVLVNGLLIHMFGVGLPSALFARRAYA